MFSIKLFQQLMQKNSFSRLAPRYSDVYSPLIAGLQLPFNLRAGKWCASMRYF
jgi:hypothetical protein